MALPMWSFWEPTREMGEPHPQDGRGSQRYDALGVGLIYLLVRFTQGIFGNDPFHHYSNNNPSNPQQPIHSLRLV